MQIIMRQEVNCKWTFEGATHLDLANRRKKNAKYTRLNNMSMGVRRNRGMQTTGKKEASKSHVRLREATFWDS